MVIKLKKNVMKTACQLAQLKAKLLGTDANGYGRCVSCGEVKPWDKLHGGHYQPKGVSYNGACLDERNINPQCSTCNTFMGGNPAGYMEFMITEYGDGIGEELFLLSKEVSDIEYARQFIVECREECRELAKEKNFKVNIP